MPVPLDELLCVEGGGGDIMLLFDRLKPIPLLQQVLVFPWS